jgi:hypothetical protein
MSPKIAIHLMATQTITTRDDVAAAEYLFIVQKVLIVDNLLCDWSLLNLVSTQQMQHVLTLHCLVAASVMLL